MNKWKSFFIYIVLTMGVIAGATIFVVLDDVPTWVDLSLIDPNDYVITKSLRLGQTLTGGHSETRPGVSVEYEVLSSPNDFTWDFNTPNEFLWQYKPLETGVVYVRVSVDPNQDGVPGILMNVTHVFRTLDELSVLDTWWIKLTR